MVIKVQYDVNNIYVSSTESPVYITVGYGDGGGITSVEWGDIDGTLSDQTDLQAALDAKVPYSGATGNVDLGEYELKAGQIEFDQTPTGAAGTAVTKWNDTVGTIETTLKGGSVVLKHGRDMFERVVNKTGVQLTKAFYQAVRVSTAQGQRLGVALAQANNDNNSADTIGLAVETIDNNQEGMIYTVGEIDGINTTGSLQGETWADGDVLYLSPTTAGRITNVKPIAPQHLVVIGYVVYAHANNGKIYVKVMNGWELGELHDVNTTGATNGQVLAYNGSIWVPTTNGSGTVTSITASAPLTGGTITSSGSIGITQASGSADGYLSSTDWTTFNNKQNALTNPITGTGASGQVAYFTGTTSQAGSATFTFSPTAQLLLNNSVTASSAIARGANFTPTLTAAANNDVLVGLDVSPTFTNGAFTGLWNIGARAITSLNGEFDGFYLRNSSNSAAAQTRIRFHNDLTPNNTSGTNGGVIFYTSSTAASPYTSSFGFWNYLGGNIIFATNNSPRAVIFGTGNLAINSTTDGGQRLQVQGTTLLNGVVTIPGTAGGVTITPVSSGVGIDITTFYNNNALKITHAANADAIRVERTGLSNVISATNSTTNNQRNQNIAAIDYIGTYQHFGTAGLGQGIVLNVTNNTGTTGNLSGAIISATANSAGATAIGIDVQAASTSGAAWALFSRNGNNHINGDTAIGTTTLGTATKVTIGGSETASSAIARGTLINTTLTAAANNDVLVGLDVNPTFTNGAFTGVSNIGVRAQSMLIGTSLITGQSDVFQVKVSNAIISLQNTANNLYAGVNMFDDTGTLTGCCAVGGTSATVPSLAGNFFLGARKSTGKTIIVGGTGATQLATMFSTGNFLIQNAGTHTDAGFRLDVNGTARVQGATTITAASSTTSPILTVTNTSSGNFTFSVNNSGTGNANFGMQIDGTNKATIGYSRSGDYLGFFHNGASANYFLLQLNNDGSFQHNKTSDGTADFKIFNNGGTIVGASTLNASAQLQVDSTTRGFLPPRMTETQKNAIATPAAGLMVYDTTNNKLYVYDGTTWQAAW